MLSKRELINALVASHGSEGVGWDRFYRSWTREALRTQLAKRTARKAN